MTLPRLICAGAAPCRAGLLALGLICGCPDPAMGDTGGPSAHATAWQTLSYGFHNDAAGQFQRAGDSREARLGAAIAQISRSPVTASSLLEARQRLEQLLGDDELGHAARYWLGRLHQLHPIEPDVTAAARHFEELVTSGADDVWSRLALVKLALLRLTALPVEGGLDARLEAVAPLFTCTSDPGALRDLHLVIAEVRLHHQRYDRMTRAHLLEALAAPVLGPDTRTDLLIQIARISEILGDTETSRDYYERFLREYPRDRRRSTVELILSGGETPGPQ